MAERSTGLPSQRQVVELLEGEFGRAGFDIEDVVVDATARPPRITVVADGDGGLDLDSIAQLSRTASELLDELDSAAYVLEVTSPGVDRPLTNEKHYRRAQGRLAELMLADGSTLAGRIGQVDDGTVGVVVREARKNLEVRHIALDSIVKAVVQVEFSKPSPREMELAGVSGKEAST
ncbi:ribosome maturation factor RimP [Mycobacterium sp. 236(2023)]|uniref:ribosome maturation factor RimP n=1 Tax=Mycobacterium sp. 236(2023) TaxID=3038163 RepID=UPI00241504A4|nr:ribosome maturation factor RimP [Mycobacterium sp. 236(2023)]MDG4664986.1 ribosome maturation factor RimP [Mycobacterium sp. 236(2023)]